MDLGLSRDMFDSFVKYQAAIQAVFRRLQKTYNFTIVDANRLVDAVTKKLRKEIRALLGGNKIKCPERSWRRGVFAGVKAGGAFVEPGGRRGGAGLGRNLIGCRFVS